MSDIDEQILAILERDGRRSFAAIGREVALSTAAVKRRVHALEERGVIRGYRADIDRTRRAAAIEALIELRFDGTVGIEDMASRLGAVGAAEAAYTLAGDQDALVHVRVRDVEHLQRVIDQLRRAPGAVGTRTTVVLGSWRRG